MWLLTISKNQIYPERMENHRGLGDSNKAPEALACQPRPLTFITLVPLLLNALPEYPGERPSCLSERPQTRPHRASCLGP